MGGLTWVARVVVAAGFKSTHLELPTVASPSTGPDLPSAPTDKHVHWRTLTPQSLTLGGVSTVIKKCLGSDVPQTLTVCVSLAGKMPLPVPVAVVTSHPVTVGLTFVILGLWRALSLW